MATNEQDALRQLTGDPGTPVPPVAVHDMKALWQEFQNLPPGTGYSIDLVAQLCPGADAKALAFRCMQLMLIERLAQFESRPFEITEGVFHVVAEMPLEYLEVGKTYSPTFDFDDFFAKVRAAESSH